MEEQMIPPIIFNHPFTCIIAGPTQSGKTIFTKKLLENSLQYISPPPTKIVWAYGEKNMSQMRDIQKVSPLPIEFVEGIPDIQDFKETENNLLILDDLMTSGAKSTDVSTIFTRVSHHRNLSIIFIIQNIFHRGSGMRDISLNSKYTILFKNPRDSGQIQHLSRQIFPRNSNFLVDAYKQATKRPHGYIILDFDQQTPEHRRVLTGIFPPEFPMAFIPKK